MSLHEHYATYLEALKILKEWSTALVVVQTGAMAVLGGLVRGGSSDFSILWLAVSLGCFLASILVAAHVVGAIPRIVQHLPEYVEQHGDIYQMKNAIGISLGMLAFAEHLLFAGGLISFGGFVCFQATGSISP